MTESSGESKVTVHWDEKRGKRGQECESGGELPSKRDQRTGDSLAMEVIKEMSRNCRNGSKYNQTFNSKLPIVTHIVDTRHCIGMTTYSRITCNIFFSQ